MTLNRHRIAVIDASMLIEGCNRERDATAARTQSTLSEVKAYYDDLLGPDNALTAEAQVSLILLGLADGFADDPGARSQHSARLVAQHLLSRTSPCLIRPSHAAKKAQLAKNAVTGLKTMARALPGGLQHSLVIKLRSVCEAHLGALDITEHVQHNHHDHSTCGHKH